MRCFVYVSTAVKAFSQAELEALLDVSRRRNDACGVTGMLLYVDGNFMQLLEGPEDAVAATRARIAADPRHHTLITLLHTERSERHFQDWSMGFRRPEASSARLGFTQLHSLPRSQQAELAVRLLMHFAQNNR
jgi:hypothetical protein